MTKRTIQRMTKHLAGLFIMMAVVFGSGWQAYALLVDVPPAERAALVALYNAAGGSSWTTKTNWNTGDPCLNSWYGITCNGSNVTQIMLGSNNLNGTIPATIGNLSQLSSFSVQGNFYLSGSIPRQLGNLSQLQVLQLGWCNLKGSIPQELSSLSQLRHLSLSHNSLVGSIPKWLGSLSQLDQLWLEGNSFTGAIPKELGSLSQLTILRLSNNMLCGMVPVALSNLYNLKDGEGLNINNNNLLTEVQPPLFNVFIVSKSNFFGGWQTTQNSKKCFSWPMYMPALSGIGTTP